MPSTVRVSTNLWLRPEAFLGKRRETASLKGLPNVKTIVTIDGPAGSGKTTASRLVAKQLGYLYLDTGAMYRAAALQAAREGVGPEESEALGRLCRSLDLEFRTEDGDNRVYLGGEDVSEAIRSPEMDLLSSTLSAVKEVREAITGLQRKLGSRGCIVAEGRDMGTVVFPEANFKFFLVADPKIRAERRYLERTARGETVRRQDVEKELRKRDEQDTTRPLSPLRPATDARIIDTSTLDAHQVMDVMLKMIQEGGE
jgi:cytidylate kinase